MELDDALTALRRRLPGTPDALVVLGSGLGPLVAEVVDPVKVPFADVPGLPAAGVAGHGGAFVFGRVSGRPLLLQAGRFHLYEGHSPEVVSAPVRLAARLGVKSVLVTNAAGGIRRTVPPGSLVLVEDHLNLMFRSPLVGPVMEGEDRFPDMSAPYDPDLRASVAEEARRLKIPLHQGVYAGVLGPSYETPSEIRMLERMGAHVVGMSTVPEVLAARSGQLPVVALSLVTNWAAGLSPDPLNHQEVLEAGERASKTVRRLVRAVVPRLP